MPDPRHRGERDLPVLGVAIRLQSGAATLLSFAALVARMLAGMVTLEKGGHQVYLDDSLWMLQGSLMRRSSTLAAVLMTMLSLGAKLAGQGLPFTERGLDRSRR